MSIAGIVVAGSLAYAGAKLLPRTQLRLPELPKPLRKQLNRMGFLRAGRIPPNQTLVYHLEQRPTTISPALQQANRAFSYSTAGLGMAAAGSLLALPALLWVTIPLSVYFFLPSFDAAYKSLKEERRITAPVLDATRITVCIVMGYLFSAALNAWLESISQRMLLRAKENFDVTSRHHFGQKPEMVWLMKDGVEVEIPIEELQPGMVITLTSGEVIPAHGTILYGSARVDEQIITGASKPIHKDVGASLIAETVVQEGQLFVLVEEKSDDNTLADVTQLLQESIQNKTFAQQLGEQVGDNMAPLSLLAFGLTLPFWGANRAASLLTTSFGVQMRELGPYLRHNFVDLAARQQILVRDARTLEMINLVNTVVIDVDCIADPSCHGDIKEMIFQLRQSVWAMKERFSHSFAVYLMATATKDRDTEIEIQGLAAKLGFDDYFIEPLSMGKAAVIEKLQSGGRMICYVGDGVEHAAVMQKSLVAVSCSGAVNIKQDRASIVLLANHPGQLHKVFHVATQFAAREGTSIVWPLVMDAVDIGTTVFMHWGLVYSVMINYSGFLASAIDGRIPLSRYLKDETMHNETMHNESSGTKGADNIQAGGYLPLPKIP